MLRNIITSLVVLLFVNCTIVSAQKLPFKLGNVSAEEMAMESCSFYPDANSMILGEYGVLKFRYHNDEGWKYDLNKVVRIKIFDITDGDAGNIKFRMYDPESGMNGEEMNGFKAYTHNLVNGKIVKEKIGHNDVFKTRINKYWMEFSFAMPNVQNGSVIEYSIDKVSDYVTNLTTWKFQHEIPVALSEFRYTIPEYFEYQATQLGYVTDAQWEQKEVRQSFAYTYETIPATGGHAERHKGSLESISNWKRVYMNNIPPLEEEPYMNNVSDIPGRIEFQLISTKFPNSVRKHTAGNYEKFNKELISSSSFGGRLNKGNYIAKQIGSLESGSNLEKAAKIYDHISNHFSWDELYAYYSDTAGKEAYISGKGDVADINLSLIAGLREYEIQAFPILLSTRGHGSVHPTYPDFKDYNYVIAGIMVDGKIYYADATSELPFSQLPRRCRNGNAWMVGEPNGQWVDLKAGSKYNVSVMLHSTFVDGTMKTTVSQGKSGYAGIKVYNDVKKLSEVEYLEKLAEDIEEGEIKNLKLPEVDYSALAKVVFEMERPLEMEDIFYIQPIMMGSITENPFQKEERFSVIDFPYSQLYNVISSFEVPEGYTAELPIAAAVKLPDGKGSFRYNVSQEGNKITVVSKVTLKESLFTLEDYPLLKQFYQMVVDKNQEPIVFKK